MPRPFKIENEQTNIYYNNEMKIKALAVAAICTAMMACNSNQTDTAVTNRVELPGTVDNEAFAGNVESISVMNLEMGDDWAFGVYTYICLTDNYIYLYDGGNAMANSNNMSLTCFDQQTGKMLSSRKIKGNGPGEINEMKSMFCIGDTLCIYDNKNIIRKYDYNCHFIGILHEFSNLNDIYDIVRLNSGNYAFVAIANSFNDTVNAAIMMADKSFNIISKHYPIPPIKVMFFGVNEPCYVDGDTIRLICRYDNHLYTLCGDSEQCAELVLPNPITIEKANELFDNNDHQSISKYDGDIYSLSGSGRFVLFIYRLEGSYFLAMVDKRTNKAISIPHIVENDVETTADLVNRIICDAWAYKNTHEGYIFANCRNGRLDCWLEYYDELLDERLQKTRAEYRAYLERNAEFIKGLDEDEREAANVILKIKLKD